VRRLLTIFLLWLTFFLSSFTHLDSFFEVIDAIKTGDTRQLSLYFDERIDLYLPSNTNNYSKSQAELILKDFFLDNKVRGFRVRVQGSKSGQQFCDGILITSHKLYNTRLLMRNKQGRLVLYFIEIIPKK
jgi:Domain of unknown function (DUF4783)